MPATNDGVPEVAFVGVLRTAVLALSAVLLALVGRWVRVYEATLLVYPILV
ncbi:MAG: hypothetical protein GWN29_00170, partial [Gammaproteobacteria bacterium]|nr:hypothetical protein [Gammaproteobacteria bacterium]